MADSYPPDSDEAYAEWYAWARREVSSDVTICVGAAEAAVLAVQDGADRQDAAAAARRSTAGQTPVLERLVPVRRRRYGEWYDWARRAFGGDPAHLHAAARAALDALERRGSTDDAVAAAREAAGSAGPARITPAWPITRQPETATPPARLEQSGPPPTQPAKPKMMYGGLGRRLLATLIDAALFTAGVLLLINLLATIPLITGVNQQPVGDPLDQIRVFALASVGFWILMAWAYNAGMESSSLQATLGKAMLGVMVTDVRGRRISFARASARYWLKLVLVLLASFLAVVGIVLASLLLGEGVLASVVGAGVVVLVVVPLNVAVLMLSRRQQSLYDMATGTLVVKRDYQPLIEEQANEDSRRRLSPGPPPPPRPDPYSPVPGAPGA